MDILVTKLGNIFHIFNYFRYLCLVIQYFRPMTIVSAREFRANQSRYFGMVNRGEHVVLKSRMGRFRLMPIVEGEEEPKRDVTTEVCRAMKDWKDYLDGNDTGKFRPAEELLDELRSL